MPHFAPALQRQPRDSLATKFIFFVFLSTFVTALTVTWISVRSTYSVVRGAIQQSLPDQLDHAAIDLEGALEDGLAELEVAARSAPLRRAAWRRRVAKLEPLLEKALATASSFNGLLLRDRKGRVLGSVGTARALAAPDAPPPAANPSPGLGTLSHGEQTAPIASVPFKDRKGRVYASLEGLLDPDFLAAQLRSDRLGPEGDLLLFDAEGHLLARGHPSARADSAWVPEQPPPGEDASALRSARAGDGTQVLTAQRPLAKGDWILVVEQPARAAFAPIFSLLLRVLMIDLVIVLLFSFLAYEITGAILRPVEALYHGARRVSHGELDVEIPVTESNDEIALLTRTFNDMTRRLAKNRSEIESAYAQVQDQNDELQRANEVLAQLSITDGLTKLHNHRYFQDHLTREIKRVSRNREPLAMLLIDIDDFKRLNDRLGHAAGDELLVRIARILNDSVRESDLLARYGGEEFVVLATGTDREGALQLAEKVRTAIAEASFILDDSMRPYQVTISLGVAEYAGSRKDFFQAADRALYRAKAEGKNCVVVAEAEA